MQLKLPELCASLELQAAASDTGVAAFRFPRRGAPVERRDPSKGKTHFQAKKWVSKGPKGPSWGVQRGKAPLVGDA